MDKYGMQMALVMSPPSARAGSFEVETQLAEAAQSRPDRFAYLGGGSVLNPLIQQTAHLASVPTDLQQRFEKAAQRVIEVGAIGFGETAVLHLSLSESHPFEEAPPDSPLFLLLADIAAQHDVPIDIHLQAVLSDMPTPPQYNRLSTRNPETLHANIAAFERLLMHNEKARIVWAHVGWDNTGDMTVDLVRQLVEKHSNLYLQMTFHGDRLAEHSIVDREGNIRAEWLDLIEAHPDRFVVGSDTFFGGEEIEREMASIQTFLGQLPPDLARQVGCDNAITIYKLRITCSRE